ncbi:hypothetical protein BH23ACT7_BH23ACT7_13460 [soil metagenome]
MDGGERRNVRATRPGGCLVCEAYGRAVKAIITRRGEGRLAGYETLERASGQVDADDLKAALNDMVAKRERGSGLVRERPSAAPDAAVEEPGSESPWPDESVPPPLAEIDPATDGWLYLSLLCLEAHLQRPLGPPSPASERRPGDLEAQSRGPLWRG